MTRSVVGRLIAKDLYLHRWLISGSVVAGLVSIVITFPGGVAETIGSLLLVTTIITLGVILAVFSFLIERQAKSMLFVLSLPVSPLQYAMAKVAAALAAFLIPWAVFTATLVALILGFDPPPDGRLPFTVLMMLFFLANFCILIAFGAITASEYWGVAAILVTNLSVPVFLGTLLPRITGPIDGPTPRWTTGVWATVGVELAVIALSLGLTYVVLSRRKDFV